jgi:cytochrome P450
MWKEGMMNAALAERPEHVSVDRVVDFDIYNPPGVKKGFHEAWKTLQAQDLPDVVWTPHNGGHWLATRFDVADVVCKDYETFSSRVILVPKELGELQKEVGIPSSIDPPDHRPYRMLLNKTLSPKSIGRRESYIRSLAIELIESFRLKGGCHFTKDYAEILPVQMFMDIMNLPPEDGTKLKIWSDAIIRPTPDMPPQRAVENLHAYMAPYVEERMGSLDEDMISQLINGKVNDRALTSKEIMSLSTQVFLGGLDTVVSTLGFIMLFLARNPAKRRELASDISFIPDALNELFRRFPIATVGREIKKDTVLGGVELKAGEMIIVGTSVGGLDDRANACPMDVDFHRASSHHITFGNGMHKCPGFYLARSEIRITLEEWLKRIPEFDVAPGATITFTGGISGMVDALPLVWNVATTKEVAS